MAVCSDYTIQVYYACVVLSHRYQSLFLEYQPESTVTTYQFH